MRQSVILINAALIIAKMVFNIMNERDQSGSNPTQKSLMDSASGILLGKRTRQSVEKSVTEEKSSEEKTVAVEDGYAYVNSGHSLIIYNVSNQYKPTIVSETLF